MKGLVEGVALGTLVVDEVGKIACVGLDVTSTVAEGVASGLNARLGSMLDLCGADEQLATNTRVAERTTRGLKKDIVMLS